MKVVQLWSWRKVGFLAGVLFLLISQALADPTRQFRSETKNICEPSGAVGKLNARSIGKKAESNVPRAVAGCVSVPADFQDLPNEQRRPVVLGLTTVAASALALTASNSSSTPGSVIAQADRIPTFSDAAASQMPEPATLILLGSGLAFVGQLIRRKSAGKQDSDAP
jgi:hypothetical protein